MLHTRTKRLNYPLTRCIAIDVDGTLIINNEVNHKLIEWCKDKKEQGYLLLLWSARGQDHALNAADISNTTELFDHIVSKPGYIVDDQGWKWARYTRAISPCEI